MIKDRKTVVRVEIIIESPYATVSSYQIRSMAEAAFLKEPRLTVKDFEVYEQKVEVFIESDEPKKEIINSVKQILERLFKDIPTTWIGWSVWSLEARE